MRYSFQEYIRFILPLTWIVLTLALSCWWILFFHHQIALMEDIAPDRHLTLAKHSRMLLWEGGTLVLLILIGGGALLVTLWKEQVQRKKLSTFFSVFTHELRTSLSSFLVRLEGIGRAREEQGADNQILASDVVSHLQEDAGRLVIQLENALLIGSLDKRAFHSEKITLGTLFESLRLQWPQVTFDIQGEAAVVADNRALRAVFENLIQNAVTHGSCELIRFTIKELPSAQVEITIHDDGKGFKGDANRIGVQFHRHYSGSGSGLGLFIVRSLISKMQGTFGILDTQQGFACRLTLPQGA